MFIFVVKEKKEEKTSVEVDFLELRNPKLIAQFVKGSIPSVCGFRQYFVVPEEKVLCEQKTVNLHFSNPCDGNLCDLSQVNVTNPRSLPCVLKNFIERGRECKNSKETF